MYINIHIRICVGRLRYVNANIYVSMKPCMYVSMIVC